MSDNFHIINPLGSDLLKGFHTQFAENQRAREQSFLKILGFLGAVIIGYTYVYKSSDFKLVELSFAAIGAIILFSFGAAIITVIAYNFRRDQYVIARIRRKVRIIGQDQPFPADYNPAHILQNGKRKILWMPDIFLVFYLLFPVFEVILMLSYIDKLHLHFTISNASRYETATVMIFIISFSTTLIVHWYFYKKLKNKIGKWEYELKTATKWNWNVGSDETPF